MEIRETFHKRLREIQDDVLTMGSMVEKAISHSMEALKKRELTLAQQVIDPSVEVGAVRGLVQVGMDYTGAPVTNFRVQKSADALDIDTGFTNRATEISEYTGAVWEHDGIILCHMNSFCFIQ